MFHSKTAHLAVATGKRCISKTSSTPHSDMIQTKIENVVRFRSDLNVSRWAKIREHNNNRALSTLQTKTKPQNVQLITSKDESREFMAVFPDIVRHLTSPDRNTEIQEVSKRHAKVLQYNVPNGKKNRGLALVSAYKMLEDPELLTSENIRLAHVMGWCVEMLQACYLVADDLMDGSEMRRGAPCWHKNPDIGMSAVNDSLLLENGIFYILKLYFSQHPCYIHALELFHDVGLKTIMGQALDNLSHVNGRPNLDAYTMKRYNAIVKYKSAYYSFQLPIALAMYLAGKFDPELHRQAKTILLEMGHFFQVQDDFLDCFGNSALTGKIGNDIEEGKCTWLVVVALQRATTAQKQILVENYGRPEPECVQALQACNLVAGDIVDGLEMRRGAPCWHKNPDIGMSANLSHVNGRPNLDRYTMKRYNAIVKYKTAYYSFQLPIALAMYLAGKFDPELHKEAKTILLEMGHFFQVQDDFLDCFGNSALTGKIENDIEKGKCTWLVVVALQRATTAQKQILVENYGRPEPECVQAVRNLYEELSLPTTYAVYEEESFNLIRTHIQQISKGLPHNLFFKLMEKIYKRDS